MKKGILTFYVNYVPDSGMTVETTIDLIRNYNKELFDKLKAEGNYEICFVPTTKEASRIEKLDFATPSPRSLANSHKIEDENLDD